MKNVRHLLLGLMIGLAAFAPPWMVAGASASTVVGTPTFVGVFPIENSTGARVRVNGMCDGQQVNSLYIIIRSGPMNMASSVTMRNAYSTIVTALLSGKTLQFDGVLSCSPDEFGVVIMDLPTGAVSMF